MGEVRFIEYPDVYTKEVPQLALSLQDRGIWGVLKTRDSLGRRIICFDAGKVNILCKYTSIKFKFLDNLYFHFWT